MSKHHVQAALRHVKRVEEALKALDQDRLNRLDQASRFTTAPDGYPTATLGDGGSRGTEGTTSVERAALHISDPSYHQPSDDVGDTIRDVFTQLRQMADTATRITKGLAFIDHVGTKAAGRQSALSGACQACEREVAGGTADPMLSGYCQACFRAWVRAGKPSERPTWELERRQWLESQRSA